MTTPTYIDCGDCDGTGEIVHETDLPGDWIAYETCETCGGEGALEVCPECGGTGETEIDGRDGFCPKCLGDETKRVNDAWPEEE